MEFRVVNPDDLSTPSKKYLSLAGSFTISGWALRATYPAIPWLMGILEVEKNIALSWITMEMFVSNIISS